MRNKTCWRPTKYVRTRQGYRASSDPAEVALGSRFIAGLQVRAYQQLLQQHAQGLLLDLGCGKVPLYQIYQEHIADNICIDWQNTLHASEHLDYECDLNQSIPLPDDHVDTILLTDVLEHVRAPDRLWQEIRRVLKTGGKLILAVPFLYPVHEEPHDYFRYTQFKLADFCHEHGFEVLLLEPYGGILETLLNLLGKGVASSGPLSALHLWVSDRWVHSAAAGKVRRRTASRYPLGYCLVARRAATPAAPALTVVAGGLPVAGVSCLDAFGCRPLAARLAAGLLCFAPPHIRISQFAPLLRAHGSDGVVGLGHGPYQETILRVSAWLWVAPAAN